MKTWLWIVCGISIMGFSIFFVIYKNATEVKYEKEFEVYAAEFKVDKALIMAVAKTESGFNKNARSDAGAVGVMQLMPATASWVAESLGEEYREENLIDPTINIRYGTFYLSYLLNKYEDLIFSLACYNAGEGNVLSWGQPGELNIEDIRFNETQNFVRKVIATYEAYKA